MLLVSAESSKKPLMKNHCAPKVLMKEEGCSFCPKSAENGLLRANAPSDGKTKAIIGFPVKFCTRVVLWSFLLRATEGLLF